MKLIPLLAATTLAATSATLAADDYQAPRTEWGHPDIQGVWNFASNVPMTRPRQFGDRETMTEETAGRTSMTVCACGPGIRVDTGREKRWSSRLATSII